MALAPTSVYLPVEIFEKFVSFVCISQLLALSDTNNMFNALVILEIKRRFRKLNALTLKKGFTLEHSPICIYLTEMNSTTCKAEEGANEINIFGISYILKFLRLMGSDVMFIVCNFKEATQEQAHLIVSSINENCPNLRNLAFGNLSFDLNNSLKKPFLNVRYILFQQCLLSGRICQINTVFPNVHEITIYDDNTIIDIGKFFTKFNSLTNMEIYGKSMHILDAILIQILNPDAKVVYISV